MKLCRVIHNMKLRHGYKENYSVVTRSRTTDYTGDRVVNGDQI